MAGFVSLFFVKYWMVWIVSLSLLTSIFSPYTKYQAALDNESERIVQAALDDLQEKQPRTTLVVAHRLTTVKNCDQICVLDGGGVKELGSHSELLDKKGLYSELWTKQGGGDGDE